MQDSVEALLKRAIKQEKLYLDPRSENLGLTQSQLSMMSLLFHSNIDLADGHVTVLKVKEDHNGHVTVLKAMGPVGTIITEAMKKDSMVIIDGLGTLSTPKRAARTGRNPQTGKEIKIAAKKGVVFSGSGPSKARDNPDA